MSDTTTSGARELQRRLVEAIPVAPPPVNADPLALVVADAARRFGIAADPASLAAGLPLVNGRLAVESLEPLTERAGLAIDALTAPHRSLRAEHCPAICHLADGTLAVIEQLDKRGDLVLSAASTGGTRRRIAAAERQRAIAGVYLVRPLAAEPAANGDGGVSSLLPRRVLAANAWLYGEALIATLVINLLALAIPLYTMNIYDRVLPTGAMTTLIALSIGVALAGLLDLIMKSARGLLIDIASRRSDLMISMKVFSRLLGAKLDATGGRRRRAGQHGARDRNHS